MPTEGGVEKQLTSNIHHDDAPDYSPDGKWIYINSDRSGKESVWRFPADGASSNYGGPVVTAGDLVFIAGTLYDRNVQAFDSKTGHLLWKANPRMHGNAAPATYMIDERNMY
jgi:outer membrane protein assembly factor BamB